jgi:predicted Zn-dependent protease
LGNTDEAKSALRTALKAEPEMAAAAYNLCVLEAQENRIERALKYCAQAAEHGADEPKYGYTLAFYQMQSGRANEAVRGLSNVIAEHPTYLDAYMLLGEIHRRTGNAAEAARVMDMARRVQEQAAATAHPIRTGRP